MRLKSRQIFFWVLVLIFLVIAPLVLFYSMGYRFNSQRGIFIFSGSVTVKSTPREVDIYIDEKQVPKGVINFLNYSYHIDGLKPGKHLLEIKAENYHPWSKETTIHSGISSEFWNVLLIRKTFSSLDYGLNSVDNFYISSNNKKIAVVSNSPQTTVGILNIKNSKLEQSFSFPNYSFSKKEKENIEWSPKENKLIVPLKKDSQKEYFLIDAEQQTTTNLNELLKTTDLQYVRWNPKNDNSLYYISNYNLFEVSLDKLEEKNIIAQDIAGYDLSGTNIFYFSNKTKLIHSNSSGDKNNSKKITNSPLLVDCTENFKIITYDKKRIALLTKNGELYLYNKLADRSEETVIKKVSDNRIVGLHFSNDGKKMVFWNDNEIFVYFVNKWETQPVREQGKTISLIRFSQKISNVQWTKDYEHILFTVGNKIKIIELDHRSQRNIYDILILHQDTNKMVYRSKNDSIFYIDTSHENSNQTNLFSISLTEKNDIK